MNAMSIKTQIEKDLNDAMRARDEPRKRTLRMTLSAIKLAEVEKGVTLDDAAILAIFQKEIKNRRESIVDAERAGRPDLVAESEAEIVILESYLPLKLTAEEIEAIALAAIQEVGATSPKEMGQVMKILMPRLQGSADGSQVSQIVRKLLE
jgi:uncharacterized protein YqeY